MLWEREQLLAALESFLAQAADGAGRMVLMAGEAGVGKTSLAREFCRRHGRKAQVWWGACDALATPSPLAPLYDIARDAGGDLAALMRGDVAQPERFNGFLSCLTTSNRPVIVVIEDAHWADQATLDLLVFLGRRISDTGALIIVTYRDDELDQDHPLRLVLGRLAGATPVRRLGLPRLSEQATAKLAAGYPVDPEKVYRVTGGNPFFITELLAAPPGTVPETVRDAVLARVAQLSPAARTALEVVAVVPEGAGLAMVAEVTGTDAAGAVYECEQTGVVQVSGRMVSFRHELSRQAVAKAVPAARKPDLHAAVLAYLITRPAQDPARLAHHAVRAHDPAAVLQHAPAAAAEAARLGAHCQALSHYRQALRYADALAPPERAEMLERYAEECSATGEHEAGVKALSEALELRRPLGEADQCASVMARQAQFLYMTASVKETYDLVEKAMALVAGLPPSPPQATVYAHAAYLYMVGHHRADTLAAGERAVELAERFGDQAMLALALVALGGAQWSTDPDRAEAALVRAVEAAHESGRAAAVTNATGFLGASSLDARRYRTADRWLARVVEWCIDHDLDAPRDFYRACQAGSHFEQGRWSQALDMVAALTRTGETTYPPARFLAQQVGARLSVRRGDPDQAQPLADAWERAARSGDVMRQWPVAAARAEAAWYAGRSDQIADLVRETYQGTVERGNRWAAGELALWLWRAGALRQPPEAAAEPYALHMTGEFTVAAAAWDAIGCPFEAAAARADSGDPDEMREALAGYYRLGARPAANRLVHRLRKLGITDLPRRPHRTTGANPAGLTDRELEVAILLASGMTNADIAARLHISLRTAGHHVAAILGKLAVTSRVEVAEAARRLGITSLS
jgi:DNA-binding CsgD family transcriptional regulator/tetratricopeptide (TPR) repeat protein